MRQGEKTFSGAKAHASYHLYAALKGRSSTSSKRHDRNPRPDTNLSTKKAALHFSANHCFRLTRFRGKCRRIMGAVLLSPPLSSMQVFILSKPWAEVFNRMIHIFDSMQKNHGWSDRWVHLRFKVLRMRFLKRRAMRFLTNPYQ